MVQMDSQTLLAVQAALKVAMIQLQDTFGTMDVTEGMEAEAAAELRRLIIEQLQKS